MSLPIEISMSLPIEITYEVTLPQVLKEFRKQWSADDMIDEFLDKTELP